MLFPFLSTSSRIIVAGTKQLFVAIRYVFLTMKQILSFSKFLEEISIFLEENSICFEEELWILTSRLLFSFALCSWFFTDKFSQYVAYRGHSFMTFTKNKEGEGAGSTKFWPVLLMCFYSCGRRHVPLVNLFLSVKYTLIWLFNVTLLPGGSFNLQFNSKNKRSTKAYHESRLN